MSYYNNNQGGYQQGGGYQQQGGDYQQQGGDYQQGGHQQGRPGPPGEANSYYAEGQAQYSQHGQQEGYGQPPQQYQQNYSSPPPYQNQGYQNNGPGGPEDGERGVMGALAGGAAGAFGGHKIGGNIGHSKTSTLLGAVAGAFAGHKLQDGVSDWKHKRDEEKESEHRQDHHQDHRSGHYAGGFTGSSRDIRLDAHGDYNLRASCHRIDDSWQESCISLNKLIENDQGSFRWSSGGGGGGGGQTTYTVQQGDTLRNIAARFNTSFDEIARRNNIANPDQIWPGQSLQVPSSHGSSGGNFGASARDVRLVDGGQRLEAELMRGGDWVRSSIVLDERIGNNDGTLHYV